MELKLSVSQPHVRINQISFKETSIKVHTYICKCINSISKRALDRFVLDTQINGTHVDVLNANRVLVGDGEYKDITGVAFQVDPANEPGKLIVRLANVPFDGDCKYLVVHAIIHNYIN